MFGDRLSPSPGCRGLAARFEFGADNSAQEPSGGDLAGDPELGRRARGIGAGECLQLSAMARGGNEPYSLEWSEGLPGEPGPHEVCPTATTSYRVTARDTAIESAEFAYEAQEAASELTVSVAPCVNGEPVAEPKDLCSWVWRFKDENDNGDVKSGVWLGGSNGASMAATLDGGLITVGASPE